MGKEHKWERRRSEKSYPLCGFNQSMASCGYLWILYMHTNICFSFLFLSYLKHLFILDSVVFFFFGPDNHFSFLTLVFLKNSYKQLNCDLLTRAHDMIITTLNISQMFFISSILKPGTNASQVIQRNACTHTFSLSLQVHFFLLSSSSLDSAVTC